MDLIEPTKRGQKKFGRTCPRLWVSASRNVETYVEYTDFLNVAIKFAFVNMSDNELMCFIMYYMCGIEQKDIAQALEMTQQGVSFLLKSAIGKAKVEFIRLTQESE